MKVRFLNYYLSLNNLRLRSMLLSCLLTLPVLGQQDKMMTVVVKEGQHIRDLAEKYLHDANLWTEILRVNDLHSVTEVKPGMELKIPSGVVSMAGNALNKAMEAIQEATQAGARMFAPAIISNAIDLREKALEKRKQSDWESCAQLAISATVEAERALKESRAKNDVSAEAVLNDRRGNVDSRKQVDLIWKDAPLYSILVEQEKIRTLSQSIAEILFRDESRLRLNANSQAIVQSMRIDLLKNEQEATVSLIEGDIYALLAESPRKKFNVEVPGVSTKINSTNFWIGRDSDETARFANYKGELEVSSGGSTIVLSENQGSLVRRGRKPTSPAALLSKPTLLLPAHHGTVYQTSEKKEILFSWEPVEGAVSYWIEIAFDKSSFKEVVLSRNDIKVPRFVKEQIGNGVYYWNVAAIDNNGFPGVKSEARLIKVITDDTPPYLIIHSPKQGEICQACSVRVAGETECDVVLTWEGRPVDIFSDGKFGFDVLLTEGLNDISLEAVDPAGNRNTLVRTVTFVPYRKTEISHDPSLKQVAPGHFVAQGLGFTFKGRAEPASLVEIQSTDDSFRANTFSDVDEGVFTVSVPLMKERNEFDLSVTTLAEYHLKDRFVVEVDLTPPEIRLDPEPPRVSESQSIPVKGFVSDGTTLTLNGNSIELTDGRFEEMIELRPGKNKIQLIASDLVGNTSCVEREVVFDNEPPKLLKYDLSHRVASGGESVHIIVFAEDEFGMKRAAKFTLQAGDFKYADYLIYCRDMACYQQTVNLPQKAKGEIEVTVELEDYHGNKKEVRLR